MYICATPRGSGSLAEKYETILELSWFSKSMITSSDLCLHVILPGQACLIIVFTELRGTGEYYLKSPSMHRRGIIVSRRVQDFDFCIKHLFS